MNNISNPVLAAEINALPERVRQFIHNLEADADPAGDKWRLLAQEQNIAGLTTEINRLQTLLRAVQSDAGNWLHGKLQDEIETAVGAPGPYRSLDDSGV